MNEAISIYIIDDQPVVRAGLTAVLQKQTGLHVVGQSGDGTMALQECTQLKPAVVFLDLGLKGLSPTLIIRSLRELNANVVVLCDAVDGHAMREAVKAGAAGLVLAKDPVETFVYATRTVATGDEFLSEPAHRLVSLNAPKDMPVAAIPGARALTPRELEVLKLIADGETTSEIATRLSLSVKTIETHRKNVMDKLHTRSIAQLTKFAIQSGLTTLEN